MPKAVAKLVKEIRDLPDQEQLRLVDVVLAGLDKPDPELDKIWAAEARRRLDAYKAGRIPSESHAGVMARHKKA